MQSLQAEDTKFTDAFRRSFVPLHETKKAPERASTTPLTPTSVRVLSKMPHMSVGEALKEARSWW